MVSDKYGVVCKDEEIQQLWSNCNDADLRLLEAVTKLPRHGKKCNCKDETAKTKFLKRIKFTECKCKDTLSPFQLVIK